MKHLKIFENNKSVNSIRKMIIEYKKFLKEIQPYILNIYEDLAADDDYEPNYGSKPYETTGDLCLEDIGHWPDGLQFVIHLYNSEDTILHSFYIEITNEELDEILMKMNANKYNL